MPAGERSSSELLFHRQSMSAARELIQGVRRVLSAPLKDRLLGNLLLASHLFPSTEAHAPVMVCGLTFSIVASIFPGYIDEHSLLNRVEHVPR